MFVGLCETYLTSNILNEEVHMSNYILYRSDRTNRPGGGVCLYVCANLACKSLLTFSNSMCEALIIEIMSPRILIVNMYRPPNATLTSFEDMIKNVTSVLTNLQQPLHDIFIMGDFNFPNIDWNISDDYTQQSSFLFNLKDLYFLEQVITSPTRKGNILDLLFCSSDLINSIRIEPTTMSDHNMICVETKIAVKSNVEQNIMNPPKTVFEQVDYYKADWAQINASLAEADIVNDIVDLDAESAFLKFTQTVGNICYHVSPKKDSNSTKLSKFLKHRKCLMRKRTKLLRKLNVCHISKMRHYKNKLSELEQDILTSHDDERKQEEIRAISRIKTDPNYFFRYAKKFSKCKNDIGPLCNANGGLVHDKNEMCNILVNQFKSVFSTPLPTHTIHDIDAFFDTTNYDDTQLLTNIDITDIMIVDAIKSMPTNSAPGPDGMHSSIFKHCVNELITPLRVLFQKSLDECSIPQIYKYAAIVPVYKGGDKATPANYRPISLTPIMMKIFERVVRTHIVRFLTDNNHFNSTQHGFREGRSCLSALLSVYDDMMLKLSKHPESCVDMIYLDFAKAFDKVDHGVLLHKLRSFGISGSLGKWIHSFLTNRKQYVRIRGGTSPDCAVESGVPQGTVLGPLLFLILISDISNDVNNSRIISFADDTRLFYNIQNIEDCSVLQNDLDTVYSWSENNNMMFNDGKFQHLSFYAKSNHVAQNHIYVNASHNIIETLSNTRDLGITFTHNCSFDDHINNKVKQCRQIIGWILRTFTTRDKHTMLTLFKSIVLSRIDFGCQLWSPVKKSQIRLIEDLQRKFTKHIVGMKSLSYAERLRTLKLYSLQRRRDRYTAIYMWKISEGLVPNFENPLTTKYSDRRGRTCDIVKTHHGYMGTLRQ